MLILSSKLPSFAKNVKHQYDQQWLSNPRFRWMVWSVLYIVIIYMALVVRDWRQLQSESLEQLLHKSTRLEQLKGETEWPQRLAHEKEVGKKVRSKLWQAATPSLAEADLQNALRKLLTTHSAQNIRLRLAPSETLNVGGEELIRVTAEVAGNLNSTEINHLLKSLADSEKTLFIERFSYSAQGSGQITLFVVAYFIPVDAESSAQGGENAPQ